MESTQHRMRSKGCQCTETYSLTGSLYNFLVLLHFTLNSCTCSPLSTRMLWAALLGGGFAFLVGGLPGGGNPSVLDANYPPH